MFFVIPAAIMLLTTTTINHDGNSALQTPYFYEYDGKIFNLSIAKGFYVSSFCGYHWPSVTIGSSNFEIGPSMKTEEEAMEFIRKLANKVQNNKD
jgi:hypothetical protein